MKVLFVHDHPFVKDGNIIYTTGSLNSTVWKRYLVGKASSLYVIGRNLPNRTITDIASTENVYFELSNHYKNPLDYFLKYKLISSEINSVMKNIDAVIVRLPSILGLISIDLCKKNKIPYLVEVVGDVHEAFKNYGNISGKILANYIDNLHKKSIWDATHAIYVTNEYLQDHYPCRNLSENISNVSINTGNTDILKSRIDKIKNKSNSSFTVGMIGNVNVKYKGYDVFMKVLKRLTNEGYDITYRIVGPGSQKRIYKFAKKLGIQNKVKLEGGLPKEKISAFLSEIDLYVHTSFQEGLPRVIIEAMSQALPILATTAGGTPELIDDKYLHKPGDAEKLYTDMKHILKNDYNLEYMAKENWINAQKYDFEILQSKREKFLNDFYNSIK